MSETWANYGEVFTRRWVVEALLDLTGYQSGHDLGALRLVEPSCGSGAFLRPAVERLIDSARRHGRDLRTLVDAVRAYDLQPMHVETSREICVTLLQDSGMPATDAVELAQVWVNQADFLLEAGPYEGQRAVDVVIGNPPYIRYDDLPEQTLSAYRSAWSTMRGRGDIYVGFFERALSLLRSNGRVGFICADRWMRNQYGAALREFVAADYAVEHIWTMHDVDAFDAPVSAYPAITVLANASQGPVVVAETTDTFSESSARALEKWSNDTELTEFDDVGVNAHRLPHWFEGNEMWPTGSPARLALVERLRDKFAPLHNPATGTKVSIGVASGADTVYVTKDPNAVEPDRLLPLAMREDLSSGTFEWQGNYLVNPWEEDGSLVDLTRYPRMARYLGAHTKVRERFVAKQSPSRWHRTIDKVNASITSRPKLLLQDMRSTIHPVLEHGGHYPHHNLYYVTSDSWDMEVLGGLLLSRVAQAFVEAYCVRMRGGTLRFQAQYLKQIRLPDPGQVEPDVAEELRTAFRTRDADLATKAAGNAYDIDLQTYELA